MLLAKSSSNIFVKKRRVHKINHSFERYPKTSIASLWGCEIVSLFGTHLLIVSSGWVVPPTFALGFVVSRAFRRVRLPLDIASAGILYKLVPELAEIKMTWLISGTTPQAVSSNSAVERIKKWSGTTALVNVIDKFGACYFVGARWTGALSTLMFATALGAGFDLTPIMNQLGVSPQLGTELGSWAAAVTLSSVFYPATIAFGGAVLTPKLAKLAKFSN